MKRVSAIVLFAVILLGGKVFADEKQDILDVAKGIVAEEKTRFGIDVKKCHLECERVYSKEHCKARCAEIADHLRNETYEREEADKAREEEEKPLKYKEVAEKYR